MNINLYNVLPGYSHSMMMTIEFICNIEKKLIILCDRCLYYYVSLRSYYVCGMQWNQLTLLLPFWLMPSD